MNAIQVLICRLNQNATPEKTLFTNLSFFLSNIWCFLDLKTTCASFRQGLLPNAVGQFVSPAPVISKAPVVQAPPVCSIYSLCQPPPTCLHKYSCTSPPPPRHSCFCGLHTALKSLHGIRNIWPTSTKQYTISFFCRFFLNISMCLLPKPGENITQSHYLTKKAEGL